MTQWITAINQVIFPVSHV